MGTTDEIFKGMLESIEAKAKASIAVNEGDYIFDGLWYCGKCDTPKQAMQRMAHANQIHRSKSRHG